MKNLSVSLLQYELAWENPEKNRRQVDALIQSLPDTTDLIVLPEMFTTGFSMNAVKNAEPPRRHHTAMATATRPNPRLCR